MLGNKLHLVGFAVLLSPQEQQDLGHHDGAKEDEDHLSVHEVVTLVLLFNHPAGNKKQFGCMDLHITKYA